MYDLVMEKHESDILPSALLAAMTLRKMSAAELARRSGVDKSTISLILSGDRPNTPAVIVAKLARGLNVSMDFLVGIATEAEPRSLGLGEILLELTQVAKHLTKRRQRDLLMMARAYLEAGAELKGDPDLLMDNMLDLINEAGGTVSRDRLIDLLDADEAEDDDNGLLGDGSGTPPDDPHKPPDSNG